MKEHKRKIDDLMDEQRKAWINYKQEESTMLMGEGSKIEQEEIDETEVAEKMPKRRRKTGKFKLSNTTTVS